MSALVPVPPTALMSSTPLPLYAPPPNPPCPPWSTPVPPMGFGRSHTTALTPCLRAAIRQFSEMRDFFRAQFVIKRANPGEDLISTLLASQLDGKPIPEESLLTYCSTFLAAGSDTTRSLLAGMALALAEHPDQLEKLKANPDLLEGAIEESLRWVTPARGFLRTALQDTQVRGVDIKAGQRVYLLYDAGNRDAEVFADPWTYDIERPNASAMRNRSTRQRSPNG